MTDRWFEDYYPGAVFEYGDELITREETLAFAQRYDPQDFHLDDDKARDSMFGELVASGWMTCGLWMRMAVQNLLSPCSSLGSPGVDEIRWLVPVKPGDRLSVRTKITQARSSSSRPDRGIYWQESEVLRQDGTVVATIKGMGMARKRPVPMA